MTGFSQFLSERLAAGGFSTEDTLASFLPLARQVLEMHGQGFVAPLEGLGDLHVEGVRIWFEQAKRQAPRHNETAVRKVETTERAAVEIMNETRRVTAVGEGTEKIVNVAIGDSDSPIERPVYLCGYLAWEHRLEHHDELTDIFSLGMILASLACGLDLSQPEELEAFVAARRNLFSIAPGLHPTFAQAIVRMTSLYRHERAQDLRLVIHTLENYRDQRVDFDYEIAKVADFAEKDVRTKQVVVLRKLRERLFDISRRNRLLHFQATMQSVNLTHASVPLSFDIKNIRPDQIFVWDAQRHAEFTSGKSVSLNRLLNFIEALYLPSLLDRLIAETKRDRAEFGFAQLRLVICFLRWTNVKEKPIERFDSPLILLPVELRKEKGIRDSYWLEAQGTEAEINPVVRHEFKRLYNLDLPPTIDLAKLTVEEFFAFLSAKVAASASDITVQKIDRPRISLIHDKARRKLDQYRRRARLAGRGVRQFMNLDYSYDPANYHPLGIKLFSTKVRSPSSRLRAIIEEKPRARAFAMPVEEPPAVEKEQSFFSLEEGEANPFVWQYDLCSVTLANFKYRRMSLVRDYDSLLEQQLTNPAFEATFSLAPRPTASEVRDAPPLADRFDVVQCDPTQATAVGEARAGECYIIQGPPGTGKSQTITNLIADYVARDKRVLFVCEKRAAIDVVFARLRQRGLGDLCCLIHDSQTDKREFVLDLKQTYEGFLETDTKISRQASTRAELLRQHSSELATLEHFDKAMQTATTESGIPLRQLLDRAIELRDELPNLSPLEKEILPAYGTWRNSQPHIERFVNTLQELQPDGILANHPLRLLSSRVTALDRPLETISTTIDCSIRLLDDVEKQFGGCGVPREYWNTVEQAVKLVDFMDQLAPLAEVDQLGLLDAESDRARKFAAELKNLRAKQKVLQEAQESTKAWRQKLPESDLEHALQQASAFEKNFFAWLQPSWWRLRSVLKRSYDFRSHVVTPSWSQVLLGLKHFYDRATDVRKTENAMGEAFGLKESVAVVVDSVARLKESIPQLPAPLVRLLDVLIKSPQAKKIVSRVRESARFVRELKQELSAILDGFVARPLAEVRAEVTRAKNSMDDLPDFLHCLSQLAELPPELGEVFRRFPLNVAQLESAVADQALATSFRVDRSVNRFNGVEHRRRVRQLADLYDRLLDANSTAVRERVRERFQEHVRLSGLSAAQLEAPQKDFKKSYNRGRRDLEHEFGKSMRFKAIRDLVSGDSGEVVKDLKPVWLMSPLSVSDTLPLDTTYFDVVIFDEASQITLEEAVPSLFRASQAIVVGDEMQLPPTSFFETRKDEDDEGLLIEEGGELVQYELESNSFLNHAARNLPSTMLGWHYRSRSESLISFSNWAFYEGRLLTVPEEQLITTEKPPLIGRQSEDAVNGADELLRRTVSFHYLEHGVYEKRCNRAEAEYIAHLVRRLLTQYHGRTIAIVAFSEAQQTEIEDALARLAQEDPAFRELYEAELEREEDGQFVGLLVKNLENIQGDERDIIVLSVCYGRDAAGKMRMNFGPINMSGGEKRLNVAFSRAKHHMAVVSSIHFGDITNDYNEGANCFKNYLRYAEAISTGNAESASRVLHSLCRWHELGAERETLALDPVGDQLAGALTSHGFIVDRAVGQSHFRCDLAIRRPEDTIYRLGVLIDNRNYYDQADILERDVMRPKLLRSFGWNVCQVFAKDWYQSRERVLERVLQLVAGADDEEPDQEVDASGPVVASGSADSEESDDDIEPLQVQDEPTDQPQQLATETELSQAPPPISQPRSSTTSSQTTDSAEPTTDNRVLRYFEYTDEKSNKFWEITLCGKKHSVRYGRIGTAGQELTKEFSDESQAKIDFERLIRQKVAKGYQEKRNRDGEAALQEKK